MLGVTTISQSKDRQKGSTVSTPGAHIMKHSNKSPSAEVLGRLEDRAAKYLRELSPATAFATALEAEAYLAIKWAAEQAEMLRSGDTRKVFRIGDDDFQMMRQARAMVPADGMVDPEALHCLLRTLDGLPADQRWRVAYAIAFRTGVRCMLPNGFSPGSAASKLANL
jgi:hypothetical protein